MADVTFIHEKCGKEAFYYDHLPRSGEKLDPVCATLLDGSKPVSGTKAVCGSCDREISLLEVYPLEH